MNVKDPNLTPSGLRGYFPPLGPTGKGNIFSAPPYDFSTRVFGIEFEVDEEAMKSALLPPFELSKTEPTKALLWFGDWLFVPEDDPDLLYRHPEMCMYNEAQLILRCNFQGTEGFASRWLWVSNEAAIWIGQWMGFPKKYGETHLSFNKSVNYKVNGMLDEFYKEGTKLGAKTVCKGTTILKARATMDRPATPEDGIEVLPFILMRHLPHLDDDATEPICHQIVTITDELTGIDNMWLCKDPELEFFDSEFEEIMPFAPKKLLKSYYMEAGFRHTGTKTLYDFLKKD